MKRMFLAPAIGALIIATASPALAQYGGGNRRPTYGYGSGVDTRRIGYDNGFREGVKEGQKDGRSGDRYRYQDEGDFRRADVGYRNSYGHREVYRQAFRSGFADGYADGYRRYSRGGWYGDDRYGNRDDRYGNRDGRYGRGGGILGGILGRDPRYGQRGGYSVAHDNGVRDGLEKGREDIRKNRSFDPRRHEWYRDGDRSYNGRYGSRDQYKVDYRAGFNAGYDQGYRQGRYGY
jgi:hypothetical protein